MGVSQTASPLGYTEPWVSQLADQRHMLMLFYLFLLILCRCVLPIIVVGLYTMSDINGIIPYSDSLYFSFLHFGISLIVSAYALFTTIAYKSIPNSRLVRRWQMHNCIIINWWPLISGRFIDISVSLAAHEKQSYFEISLNYRVSSNRN